MQKKIKIPIWNATESFHNVEKNKKYSVLIQRNEKCYKFSNLKKAKKFIVALENQITSQLIELNQYFSFCFKINVDLIRFCDSHHLQKFRTKLNYCVDNYSKLLSHPLSHSDVLATYVSNMLYDLELVFVEYKQFIRSNNRLNFIYSDVRCKEKSFLRLQFDIKNTLYNFEPSKKDFVLVPHSENINLKIA